MSNTSQSKKESTCAVCSKQLPAGTVAYVCDACALEFENEIKEVSTSDEFGDSYDEPAEERADDDSELYDLKIEEWAEDDEILKADIQEEEVEESQPELEEGLQRYAAGIKDGISDEIRAKEDAELTQEYQKWIDQAVDVTGEPFGPDIDWVEDDEILNVNSDDENDVFGDHIENKEKDDSGLDNIFVHISEQVKTLVDTPILNLQKPLPDTFNDIMSNAGVDLSDQQSVDLFIKKFQEFDERLFEEFEKNLIFILPVISATPAQSFSDVDSDISEKNDGMKNYARYFYDMGMNVTCVSNIENEFNTKAENVYLKAPSHQWEDLWSRRQTPEEFDAYQWSRAIGFGAITGFDNLMVVDMDDCSEDFVGKVLGILGLPIDYEWVVLSGSKKGFHIYVFVDGLLNNFPGLSVVRLYPKESYIKLVNKVELLIRLHSILPPSVHPTGNRYEFVNCSLPQKRPAHIEMGKVQNFINRYFNATKQRNMMTYRKQEKEPEYPTLSKAAWSLTIAIVSGFIGFMFWPSFIATFFAGWNWFRIRSESQFSIERDAQTAFRVRREKREEEQRIVEKAREREERRKRDEEAYAVRRQLRIEIEKMPKYSNWRNAVFVRCGRACEICGETKGLEIHHRVSFDAIQRAYKISTIVQAFECDALWNVNNGSVLCKQCHEKMESSKYRNLYGQ